MDQEYSYDYIVVGGGSGGLSTAKRAAKHGKKVAVIDYVKPSPQGTTWGLGGTCVNVGCIPKKMMHYSSLLGDQIEDLKECGWEIEGKVNHNWTKMIENVSNNIKGLNWGYKMDLMENKVEYINELGSLVDAHTVKLEDKDGKTRTISGKYICLAVGGRPSYINMPGLKEHGITSDDLFWLKQAPGKTLVIGAGYIAMECSGFLQSMGNPTKVLVRSSPLRGFDQDMAKRAVTSLENIGVTFLNGFDSSKGGVEKLDNGKLKVTFHADGDHVEEFDTVLVAVGRGADCEGLNLTAAGVAFDNKNKIKVDDCNKTSVDSVFAIGDVIVNSPE